MISIFFYGTLLHHPLLETVLGRQIGNDQFKPAVLDGYCAIHVSGQPYPLLVEQLGTSVNGIVVSGLNGPDVERLEFYESGFEFDFRTVVAQTGDGSVGCKMFAPLGCDGIEGDVWSVDKWAPRWGEISRVAAIEVMGYFGKISAGELAQKFPMIRGRAASVVAAAKPSVRELRANLASDEIEEHSVSVNHAGYFLTKTYNLRYPKFSGGLSEDVRREVFIATDAAIVLPYDPVRDVVLLVEQFRMGPYARKDTHPWSIEPVAGRVDAGETPEEAAARETEEEASIQLISLEKIASFYPTPGYSSEYFYCYLGLCDLPEDAEQIGGLETEDEDIKTHILSFEKAMELLTTGEADNGPLILSLLWLERERPRLRGIA